MESFIRSPFSVASIDYSIRTPDAVYVAENLKSPKTPLQGMLSHCSKVLESKQGYVLLAMVLVVHKIELLLLLWKH